MEEKIIIKTFKELEEEFNLHMSGECFLNPNDRQTCNRLEKEKYISFSSVKQIFQDGFFSGYKYAIDTKPTPKAIESMYFLYEKNELEDKGE